MARILSLGSALQDIFLIDRDDFKAEEITSKTIFGELQIGTKVDIDKMAYEIGGGGTNSATAFARHGHEAIFLGNIGPDPAGEAVLTLLDEEGIDSSYVNTTNRLKTGCSIILLDAKSGERTILTHRGASAKFDNLDEDDLDLAQPDWLYVTTLRGDYKTIERFFKKAYLAGIKTMFNPGSEELKEPNRLLKLFKYIDVLLVNKKEAGKLVPGTTLEELLSRLSYLAPTVIITDGSMGGIATNSTETFMFGIYEDVPVKDTTGAGDAFGSGFLAHLAAGESFKDSLIFASANSTSVVEKLGAKRGILTGREELHPMPIQEL